MNQRQRRLLLELLSQPTAPFRELHVVKYVESVLGRASVPYFKDPIGNIVVGVDSHAQYLKLITSSGLEPVRVFIAHMDHPGFHGVRWLTPGCLAVKWHGGSPVKHLAGSCMWLANDQGLLAEGRLRKPVLVKGKWAIDTAEVMFPTGLFGTVPPAAKSLYGGFKFRRPVWQKGHRLFTHAADDLTGVFVIIALAIDRFRRGGARQGPPFIGLLTRAEEVGFVGAVGHFELGWLLRHRRPVLCVSLEASRTLPGAEVGKGPVVRLGDRRTVFQANGVKVLADMAEKVLPGKHQRRIMDGGSCEATAATVYGFPTVGISLPLGNYHNQGFEGGPDCKALNGPAPEFVSVDDIEGELKLCKALMKPGLPWQAPWEKQHLLLGKNYRRYRKLLGT